MYAESIKLVPKRLVKLKGLFAKRLAPAKNNVFFFAPTVSTQFG